MLRKILATLALVAFPFAAQAEDEWTGWYLGASFGAGLHANNYKDVDYWYNCTDCDYNSSALGAIFGGQFGYNWQSGNMVYGIETDFQYNTATGTARINEPYYEDVTVVTDANWMGSVRGRLGWLTSDSTMFYATAGLAYGNPKSFWNEEDDLDEFSRDGFDMGYVVGGGIETVLDGNWTMRVEALYYNLGKKLVPSLTDPDDYAMDTKNHQMAARIGFNYKLGY